MDENKPNEGSEEPRPTMAHERKIEPPEESTLTPEDKASPINKPVVKKEPEPPEPPKPQELTEPPAPPPFQSSAVTDSTAELHSYGITETASYQQSPKAYLVEYLLSLIITGTLLWIAISFFNSIVSYFNSDSVSSGWAAGFAYTSSLIMLSTALVFIPALFFTSRRTRSIEDIDPGVKTSSWRKGFLGVFLIIVSLFALGSAVALIYGVVSIIASLGVTSFSFGDIVNALVVNMFSFALLSTTAWLYSQDYRKSSMPEKLSKFHRYGLVVLVLILTVLFIFMPLRKQRDGFIDGIKSRDITSIQYAVDDYSRDKDELPSSLDQISLKDDVKNRLDNYEYVPGVKSYELCANFKTDTSGETSTGNPLEDVLSGSAYFQDTPTYTNPNRHETGRQCFEYDSKATPSYSSSYDLEYLQNLQDLESLYGDTQ